MLRKMRAPLEDLRIEARGERREEHPRVFTKVNLTYRFRGDLKASQVERAIALSHESYCSVSAMLKPGVEIEHQYEIMPSLAEAGGPA
jgi:putative redox protein